MVGVLVVAFAFGLLAAWAKGQNTDGVHGLSQVRSALGNLSTPWLLVPFFAGTQTDRVRRAVVLGLAATLCALLGFYLLSTLVENLGGHGFIGDLRLELSGNRAYFEGGLVTGPLFGALGALCRRPEQEPAHDPTPRWRRPVPAAWVVAAPLVAEPLVMLALGVAGTHTVSSDSGLPLIARIIPGWGLTATSGTATWAVYAVEFVVGIALVAVVVGERARSRRPR